LLNPGFEKDGFEKVENKIGFKLNDEITTIKICKWDESGW
jgi:hypothetical protein